MTRPRPPVSFGAVTCGVMACTCVLLLAACGRDASGVAPTPATVSGPDVPALNVQLEVRVDGQGSVVAITGVSQVEVDARATTGSGPLQYTVDFGDQTSASEPVARHVYQTPGTYQASVTVVDASGRSRSVSQAVVVRSLTGSWWAAGVNPRRGHVEVRRLTLASQRGTTLDGEFQEFGRPATRISASLDGNRTLRLSVPGEPAISGPVAPAVTGAGAAMPLAGFGAVDGSLTFQPVVDVAPATAPMARLDLQIDGSGSTSAIYRYSQIRFSATQSTGDSLSSFIEFGDGAFANAESVVHPCERNNLLTARLVVVDRQGFASEATRQYPCVGLVHAQGVAYSLAYGWVNSLQNARAGRPEFRRIAFDSQDGAVVTGVYTHPEGTTTRFHGTLTGDRGIHLTLDDGTIDFTGDVLLNDQFAQSSYQLSRHLVLDSRGGSADGTRLDFAYYDPF